MKYIEKEYLLKEYVDNKRSASNIGKEFGLKGSSILYHLKKHNIKTRNSEESVKLSTQNHITIDDALHQILTGELLGDGSIATYKSTSACVSHSSKHMSYVIWLYNLMQSYGLKWSGKVVTINRQSKLIPTTHVMHRAMSAYYPELVEYRKMWYINSTKIIPHNILLTPTVIRHWYIGDGSIDRQSDSISLHTNGFDYNTVCFLSEKLNELGFSFYPKRNRKNASMTNDISDYKLRLGKKAEVDMFFDYIGPCPNEILNTYGYKWKHSGLRLNKTID